MIFDVSDPLLLGPVRSAMAGLATDTPPAFAATELLRLVLQAHAVATLCLVGLIWFVQVVHYPLMGNVGGNAFVAYEANHVRRTTWVVAPLMLVEAVTATLIGTLWLPDEAPARVFAIAGMILLAVIWGSTFFLQVPCHDRLRHGFDRSAWRRLILTNWFRTLAWTARGFIAVVLLTDLTAAA